MKGKAISSPIVVVFLLFSLLFTLIEPTVAWGIPKTHEEITNEGLKDIEVNDGRYYDRIRYWSWETDHRDPPLHYVALLELGASAYAWLSRVRYKWIWRHTWLCLKYPWLVRDYYASAKDIGIMSHYVEDAGNPFHGDLFLLGIDIHSAYENYVNDNWHKFAYHANVAPAGMSWDAGFTTGALGYCVEVYATPLSVAWRTDDMATVDSITRTCIYNTAAYLKSIYKYNVRHTITELPWLLEQLNVIEQFSGSLQGEDINVTFDVFNETRSETVLNGTISELVNVFIDPETEEPIEHPDFESLSVAIDPPDPEPGQSVSIAVLIANWGSYSNNVPIKLLIDDISNGVQYVDLGRVNGTIVTWPWVAENGTHTIQVAADPDNLIDESCTNETETISNEDNNILTSLTTISPPPPPVGGVLIPVDKLGLLAPYIGLAVAVVAVIAGTVYAKKRWLGKAVAQKP